MEYRVKTVLKSIAALAVLTTAGAASAADMQVQQDYSAPSASPFTGAYLGAHGGVVSPRKNPFRGGKGLDAGVQGGYNAELGPAIVGGELEGSYLGDAKVRVPDGRIQERFRVAAKAKAGVALDHTLLYGTAGLTMTKFRDSDGVQGPDGWKGGYLLGAGVEQSFGNGISGKVEYNRVFTDNVRTTAAGIASRSDVRDNVLKAGINYRY
jgi:outer membrane immunogenic protein